MDIQLIAFYLPQFHPIPENDRWWGKGFTEWTNVTRAQPLYKEHYQPHLPADLGFYDLRNPETREAQAELARTYGINGFCYWHYWFNGKQLLEKPFNEVLESGKPDFPFCLAWANEPWSRRWHGLEQDVLQPQTYGGIEDDENHIRWLLRAFQDPRYMKIFDKPLFLIYNPSHLPTPERTIEHWRKCVKTNGFPDLYLIAIKSHEASYEKDWRNVGFDAELLFQPQWGKLKQLEISRNNASILPQFIGPEEIDPVVVPYEEAWKNFAAVSAEYGEAYATVVPQWDNSARRKYQPVILDHSLPEEYEKWLVYEIDRARVEHRQMVFINAWNEWAEGNHLEPDQKFGHAYLNATKNARIATKDTIAESVCDVAIALLDAGRSDRANALLRSVQERFGVEIIQKILPAKLEQANILNKNREAVQLYRSGELQRACAVLETLLQERKHPLTIQNLACVYFEQKQYERACELVRSPELRNHYSIHRKLFEAECEEMLGNTQKALQLYLELLDEGKEVVRCKERIQRLIAAPESKRPLPSQNSVTSIIVVTHNNLRYTQECLRAVLEHTTVPYELLIIDNGSSDETQQWLSKFCRQHAQCRSIFNTSNLGFPKAVNQGLRMANGDNVVLLNNDVVVTDGWLEGLLQVAQNYENVGLVGPMTNEISGAQKDRTAWYVTLEHMKHHASVTRELYRNVVYEAVRVRFFCVLITKKALKLCGGLDERFTPGNCEDDDYCLRVQRAGLTIYIARDVFVHHYGSKSFTRQGQEWFQEILKQNTKRFYAKWGIAPTDVGTNNPNEKHYPIKYPVSRNLYEEAIERALLHVQMNEMIDAARNLEEALRLMDSSEYYSPEIMNKEDLCDLAGKVYLSLGNLEKAKELFEIELHLNPTSSRACGGLGRTFYAAALYEASKTMYEYAVLYDENNNKVKEELACVNEILGFERGHNSLVESNVQNQGDRHA